ncbi:hypothetical protein E1A91_D10G194100v1 [Gossypium mustelinum]|uniref:Uncharacterized protein n=1 Tax=Gossypium mustelinum TaxID=34275 RepID=A0A5D2T9G2_GOSMU|nr:hypothetical protein E1A91_D10G194100v1 [Gossypium mustelinum]
MSSPPKKRSFLCWFFGALYPFFSHFRFQSSFLFFVPFPQEVCFWLLIGIEIPICSHKILFKFLQRFACRSNLFV